VRLTSKRQPQGVHSCGLRFVTAWLDTGARAGFRALADPRTTGVSTSATAPTIHHPAPEPLTELPPSVRGPAAGKRSGRAEDDTQQRLRRLESGRPGYLREVETEA
jgi:hypothetical protein